VIARVCVAAVECKYINALSDVHQQILCSMSHHDLDTPPSPSLQFTLNYKAKPFVAPASPGDPHGHGSDDPHTSWVTQHALRLPRRCHYPHSTPGSYYDHLNVKMSATSEAIDASYRRWRGTGYKKAQAIDTAKADALDRIIVEASLVLGNAALRDLYNASLPQQ
jgi:hypothetical protein